MTDEDRPPLAYSHNNVPVHGYEDDLLKLLQKLDAVESGGEKAVRDKRRAVVKRIEEELVWLDEKVRSEWAKWQEVNAPVQQRDEEVAHTNSLMMDTEDLVDRLSNETAELREELRQRDELDRLAPVTPTCSCAVYDADDEVCFSACVYFERRELTSCLLR